MLISLNVKNFAIIDNINVDFRDKMTVLTGETGAGKSLIIDAIGLLFGSRSSTDLIRYHESKATIEGIFSISNDELNQFLEDNGLDISDELIIKREIYETGKSTCRINGSAVTLAQLQLISGFLGDIHTQFDTHRLINPKNYLYFIDDDENLKQINNYKILLKEYKNIQKKLKDLVKKNNDDKQQLDFLKYQIQEIEKANISVEEEENLKEQFEYLNNYEQIAQNINESFGLLNNNTIDSLYQAAMCLQKIEKYDENYLQMKNTILDHYYDLEDIANQLGKNSKIENNNDQLEYVNSRLGIYSDLRRKFKTDVAGIVEYYQETKEKLEQFENYDVLLAEYTQELKNKYDEVLTLGYAIHDKRLVKAKELESEIITNLVDMQLKDTLFEIKFNEIDKGDENIFKDNGLDVVEFMVTFNKGEQLKPLSKVASGGELSRFMLALKTILSSKMVNQTLIFDEIDSGVSGAIAYSIAHKIKSISKYCQVLCVTHLPQVAAICDHHLFISKINTDDERTITLVNELSLDERVDEVSKMISNGNVTKAAKELAIELLNAS